MIAIILRNFSKILFFFLFFFVLKLEAPTERTDRERNEQDP